jgi:hypothetical protein
MFKAKDLKLQKNILNQILTKPSVAFHIPNIIPLAAAGLALGAISFSLAVPDGSIISVAATKAIFG